MDVTCRDFPDAIAWLKKWDLLLPSCSLPVAGTVCPPLANYLHTHELRQASTLKESLMSCSNFTVLSDINLYAGAHPFPAFRIVLCARSPYFRSILIDQAHQSEGKTTKGPAELLISSVSHDVLRVVLHFFYTGNVLFTVNVKQLLQVGIQFKLADLVRKTEEYVVSTCATEDVLEMISVAQQLNLRSLEATLQKRVVEKQLSASLQEDIRLMGNSEAGDNFEDFFNFNDGVLEITNDKPETIELDPAPSMERSGLLTSASQLFGSLEPLSFNDDEETFYSSSNPNPHLSGANTFGSLADSGMYMEDEAGNSYSGSSSNSSSSTSSSSSSLMDGETNERNTEMVDALFMGGEGASVGAKERSHSRASEDIMQAWQQMQGLALGGMSCSGNPDILRVSQCLIDSVAAALHCERGIIYMFDRPTASLCAYLAPCGESGSVVDAMPTLIRIGDANVVEGTVFRSGRPLLLEEGTERKEGSRITGDAVDKQLNMSTTSIFAMPLFSKSADSAVVVVGVASMRNLRSSFSSTEVQFLLLFCRTIEKLFGKFLSFCSESQQHIPSLESFSAVGEVFPCMLEGEFRCCLTVYIDHRAESEAGRRTTRPTKEHRDAELKRSSGTDFESLHNNPYMSDVYVLVGDHTRYYAHRIVLCVRNHYFQKLFQKFASLPKMVVCLKLEHVHPSVGFALLQYLYTDRVDIDSDAKSWELLRVAIFYGEYDLMRICEEYISDSLTIANVCSVHSRAESLACTHLAQLCIDFFQANFDQVALTDGFRTHGPQMLVRVAKSYDSTVIFHRALQSVCETLLRTTSYSSVYDEIKECVRSCEETYGEMTAIPPEKWFTLILGKLEGLLDRHPKAVDQVRIFLDLGMVVFAGDLTLFHHNDSSDELVAVVDPKTVIHIGIHKGIAGSCFSSGIIINVAEAYLDPRFESTVDCETNHFTQNILALPLHRLCEEDPQKMRIGVLEVLNKRSGKFDKRDEECAQLITNKVEECLNNAIADAMSGSGSSTRKLRKRSFPNASGGKRRKVSKAPYPVFHFRLQDSTKKKKDSDGSD